MRKLVLMMSVGALAVLFSAGAFAEDATTPSAPQTTPQAAPAPQGSMLQGAQSTSKATSAQPIHTHARHHHRKATTGASAKATSTGGGKSPEAAASSAAASQRKMAMASHTPVHHHHRTHHKSTAKSTTGAPAPGTAPMDQTSPSTPPSSVK